MPASETFDSAKYEIREMLKAAKYPQARIFATQLLKKYGQDAELLYLRGTACAYRSVNEQAEKDLRAAIALKPKCIEYYLALSNFLLGQARYEQAFHEYIRAKKIAPKHPKVRAFGQAMVSPNGRLNKQLENTKAAYVHKRIDRGLADRLVVLYYIKAIFNWNVSSFGNQFVFYASRISQLKDAEACLKEIDALRVIGDASKKKQEHLRTLIKANKKRRFDGIPLDLAWAGLVLMMAAIVGLKLFGFLAGFYAVSAALVFFAFQRPSYLFNNSAVQKFAQTKKGRFEYALAIAYGSFLHPSMRVLKIFKDEKIRENIAYFVRSVFRALVLPVSVFAGFYKNYSPFYAYSYLVGSLALVVALQIYLV